MNKLVIFITTITLSCTVFSALSFAANYSGAVAAQDQGQTQSIQNSFNGADPIRALPISSQPPVTMRGGPSYFSGPSLDTGSQYIPAQQLVTILNAINTRAVQVSDQDKEDIEAYVTVLAKQPKISKERCVKFEIINDKTAFEQLTPQAIVSVTTEENSVTSAALAVKLCELARLHGGSRIVILREGVVAQLESSGWGIGINNSLAVTNASAVGVGGFAVGGVGWSTGNAHYVRLPYLIAAILK